MRRKIALAALACMVVLAGAGCHKKAAHIQTTQYSNLAGVAEGTVDFKSQGEPEINIKEIRSYVGEDIDYSSGIEVKNAEQFENFQMWVDATKVDIYTVGKYTAVYKFVYDKKELEKAVSVTIVEREAEGGSTLLSGDQSGAGQNLSGTGSTGNNSGSGNGGNSGSSGENGYVSGENGNAGNLGADFNGAGENETAANGDFMGGAAVEGNGANAGNDANAGNAGNGTNTGNAGNSANAGNAGNSGNTGNSGNSANAGGNGGNGGGNSATKEIVTTKRTSTTKPSTIGYTNIELLSGKYVKIKCTSAKYIVSTRTDTSQTVRNNTTYDVAKLVITYNTGAEQVLETVETAVRQ